MHPIPRRPGVLFHALVLLAALPLALACGGDPEGRCPDGSERTESGCPGEELCPDGSEPTEDGCPEDETCPDGSQPTEDGCPEDETCPDGSQPTEDGCPEGPDPCDACTEDQICVDDVCEDLPDGCPCPLGSWCDEVEDRCVAGCQTDDHCADGLICEDGCVAGCRVDDDCDSGMSCIDLECVETPADDFPDRGFTELTPHADSVLIYVSSSLGDDDNDGLSADTPVATLNAGYLLLRNNEPDWLLLRRGDTWEDQNLGGPHWARSGRSADAPMVVATWGDDPERPRILPASGNNGLTTFNPGGTPLLRAHLAFTGFHLEPNERDPADAPHGIRWLGTSENVLFEDLYIAGFATNITLNAEDRIEDVRVRRNVLVDAWSTGGTSHGLYVVGADDVLIEENVFDHNGWNLDIAGAGPALNKDNIHVHRGTTGVVVRGNVSARGASAGAQLRAGGVCEDNLFLRSPVNLQFGQFQATWPAQAASGLVRDNVVLDSRNSDAQTTNFGILLQKTADVTVTGNLVADQQSGTNNVVGLFVENEHEDVSLVGNVVWDWAGGAGFGGWALRFGGTPLGDITVAENVLQQPVDGRIVRHEAAVDTDRFAYADNVYDADSDTWFQSGPTHMDLAEWITESGETGAVADARGPEATACSAWTAADLAGYLECVGVEATLEAYIEEARTLSSHNWRSELTPAALNRWLRRGHGLPAAGTAGD